MTNKERQEKLNIEKWKASELAMEDLSGKMLWCGCCNKCENESYVDFINGNHNYCASNQTEIDDLCLCAKAYNRMVRYNNV